MARFEFPKGFFWGAATSAHQVEGNNHNDWSEWETVTNHPVSGRACDHYNRFREDFDIAKSLGHNAHRFSIEWSRIEPEEGKWNEKEIQHYQEVVNALREREIEPFITLWHWTLPLWIVRQGGWENKKTISDFARYAEKITSSIQGVKFWITLNEPDLWAWNAYVKGIWPPQKKSVISYMIILRNLIDAHKKAYSTIHDLRRNNSSPQPPPLIVRGGGGEERYSLSSEGVELYVGIAKNNIDFDSSKFNILGRIIQLFRRFWWNHYFLRGIKNHQDFIGLNYYFHKHFGYRFYEQKSDLGWTIFPQGILHLLRELKKYNKPIYITENGLADAQDEKRAEFIKEHIKWIARTMKEGVDVRGYLYWSLLDNFEWDKGFWPRFGLVEIDYKTMERKIRPSAYEYKKIIEENSIET